VQKAHEKVYEKEKRYKKSWELDKILLREEKGR